MTKLVLALLLMATVYLVVTIGLPVFRARFSCAESRLSQAVTADLPYTARLFLLSKGEVAFYHALHQAVGTNHTIAMKVRLSDILTCSKDAWRSGHGNRIIQKHVDFVLIDPNSTQIRSVIELDDRSHDQSHRKQRDDFVDAAMRSAGIPIIHFRAAAQYDQNDIANRINERVSERDDG